MVWIRPREGKARADTITKGVALRLLLAAVFAWLGVQAITHITTVERGLRDAGLGRSLATAAALVWSIAALATAAALLVRSTARAAACTAIVLVTGVLIVSVLTWLRGTPVPCSCATPTLQRGARHHGEAVVGDVVLLALAVFTFVTTRTGRVHSASRE